MHGVLTSTESVHAPNVYMVMRHVLLISRLSPERHLLATLLIIFTMPGKPWTTDEQASFLQGYVPQYLAAQKDGTVSAFWPRVYRDWFEQYPERPIVFPGSEELSETQEEKLKDEICKRRQVSAQAGFDGEATIPCARSPLPSTFQPPRGASCKIPRYIRSFFDKNCWPKLLK